MSRQYIGMFEICESVFYINKVDNFLIAGTGCNFGLIEHHRMEYDDTFSLDENLQAFVEQIEERERNNE